MPDTTTPVPEPLPAIGTRVVHKDDHKESKGPLWEVTAHNTATDKPIKLSHAKGNIKVNVGLEPKIRHVSPDEFKSDYVKM